MVLLIWMVVGICVNVIDFCIDGENVLFVILFLLCGVMIFWCVCSMLFVLLFFFCRIRLMNVVCVLLVLSVVWLMKLCGVVRLMVYVRFVLSGEMVLFMFWLYRFMLVLRCSVLCVLSLYGCMLCCCSVFYSILMCMVGMIILKLFLLV